jgi:NAD+ diphosphatase
MLATFPPADDRFTPGCEALPEPLPADALWCVFRQGDLLLATPAALLGAADVAGLTALRTHVVGRLDGRLVLAADVAPSAPLPDGVVESNLRAASATLPAADWSAAALASQVLHWDRTNRFCGDCGERMAQPDPAERAMRCTRCGHTVYPRVSPCIIVLVHDGPRLLLTRQASWPAGRYGLVAGFVEAGESLEACVRREVAEETGLAVDEIAYGGSQPWPFPHQLMVGFYARYASGEVELRDGELEDARWFDPGALPVLPPRLSIARSLIEAFLRRGA